MADWLPTAFGCAPLPCTACGEIEHCTFLNEPPHVGSYNSQFCVKTTLDCVKFTHWLESKVRIHWGMALASAMLK